MPSCWQLQVHQLCASRAMGQVCAGREGPAHQTSLFPLPYKETHQRSWQVFSYTTFTSAMHTALLKYCIRECRVTTLYHLSAHNSCVVYRGKFINLEDISCKVKSGCVDHPAWPEGICTKCQPSALYLARQVYPLVLLVNSVLAGIQLSLFLSPFRPRPTAMLIM